MPLNKDCIGEGVPPRPLSFHVWLLHIAEAASVSRFLSRVCCVTLTLSAGRPLSSNLNVRPPSSRQWDVPAKTPLRNDPTW